MQGTLKRIADDSDGLLSLEDAQIKGQLRKDDSDEDDLLSQYLAAAVNTIEIDSRRAMLRQTWRLLLGGYPCDGIPLEVCPVLEVIGFEVLNTDGVWETVPPENYDVDTASEPGRITKAYGKSWPTPRRVPNCIRITFAAGYESAATIPGIAMQAVKFLVTHWYRNRSPIAIGTIATELDQTYKSLLLKLKW